MTQVFSRTGQRIAELGRYLLGRFPTPGLSEAQRLRNDFDAFKSSFDVDPSLIDEFYEWKRQTPIPAQPLVSVCIATYNRGPLLVERSIASILNQTYTNLELIVVGDHCTDETEALVAQIRDPRLTFVNLPERGAYPQDPLRRWMVAGTVPMNHALRMAKGDYITHLDDDDEHLPERLEKLVTFAVAGKYDLVWHPFLLETQNGRWTRNHAPHFQFCDVTTSSVLYRSWLRRIEWDIDAHRLMEPGDWNRFRRIRYLNPQVARYPEPLLRHYREANQPRKPQASPPVE